MAWACLSVGVTPHPLHTPLHAPLHTPLHTLRRYAQYLGGRLDLRPLEGYGTDCFLHLARLGAACETLPAMVTLSPAERESTHEGSPGRDFSLGNLSEYEHAVLSEKLAETRHRGAA
jgi:hypothetical protein